jgi:hypothetical protein
MAERDELEALRQLRRAREAGDERAELEALRAVRAARGAPAAAPSFPAAAGRAFLDRLAGNVASAPGAAFNLLTTMVPFLGPETRMAIVNQDRPLSGFPGLLQSAQMPPVAGERVIAPLIGQAPEQRAAESAAMAQAAPIGTGIGSTAADIVTLLGMRGRLAPTRAARAEAETARLTAALGKSTNIAEKAATSILGRGYQAAARAIPKLAGRAGETAFDAALLAQLQGADPATVAAIAGGAQVAGDTVFRPTLAKIKKVGFTKTVLGLAVAGIVAKELIPGGGTQIIEETLKDKGVEAALAAALSFGAAAATGRFPQNFASGAAGPAIAELVNVVGRGSLISLLNAQLADPDNNGPILDALSANPLAFGRATFDRIDKAMASDDPDAVAKVLADVRKRPEFKARLSAATGRAGDALSEAVRIDTEKMALPKSARVADEVEAATKLRRPQIKPIDYVHRAFSDPNALKAMEQRLGARAWNDALTVNLTAVLSKSSKAASPMVGPVLDGDRLTRAWRALPEATRNAYPPAVQRSIERLAKLSGKQQVKYEPFFTSLAMMRGNELNNILSEMEIAE